MERKMFLVDSHCHLDYSPLVDDLNGMFERARAKGIKAFLTIGTELSKEPFLKEITEKYEDVFATVGVHPHETANLVPEEIFAFLVNTASHPKIVGFGETGLDYYYDHSLREDQRKIFQAHIEAALDCHLPLVVHTREAEEDTISLLKAVGKGKVKGVLHCFSGSTWLRDQALDLGFYISVSGIITFKKAQELREVIKDVPLESLLVETDSPYLAPEPYRGKSNEPAFMIETVKKLAEIKDVSLETIALQTTQNFLTLFSKVELPCA